MSDVIPFERIVRARRQRVARALHARCRTILGETLVAARRELATAPVRELWVRRARVRKLEELEAYVAALA